MFKYLNTLFRSHSWILLYFFHYHQVVDLFIVKIIKKNNEMLIKYLILEKSILN